MMIALITNKNNPKETMVAGKVKKTKIGLTIMFSNPITIEIQMAAIKLVTSTPGKT